MMFFATLGGTIWLFMAIPEGFFPQEDIGQSSVGTEGRQDISFEATATLQTELSDAIGNSPHVAHVAWTAGVATSGGGPNTGMNSGRMFVELNEAGERPALPQILADLRRSAATVPRLTAFIVPVQNRNIGGRASKSQYQFVLQGIDSDALHGWSEKMTEAMSRDRTFTDVT